MLPAMEVCYKIIFLISLVSSIKSFVFKESFISMEGTFHSLCIYILTDLTFRKS